MPLFAQIPEGISTESTGVFFDFLLISSISLDILLLTVPLIPVPKRASTITESLKDFFLKPEIEIFLTFEAVANSKAFFEAPEILLDGDA